MPHGNGAPDPRKVERAIGVRFKDKSLLKRALVHRSYLNEQDDTALQSYERLEYLGDAFLGWIIASELYRRYPEYDEGELTKARAALVQGRTLREIADEIGVGPHLYMGQGEESHGGRERQPTLAAAVEALLGAVLLDRGEKAAHQLVLRWLEARMEQFASNGVALDAKSALQELLQARGMSLPRYELLGETGPSHDKQFTVRVLVDGEPLGEGSGRRKGDAEQLAATQAIGVLEG
ncbi:MAG: ribonuclease III [Dehalococcoidia bacterium]